MRGVGAEYPHPHVCALSTGKDFMAILFSKVKMAASVAKISNTRTVVKSGVRIVPSVRGDILIEEISEAVSSEKDTMTRGKSPIHKQIPPNTDIGAYISAEFSFTCVLSKERLWPKNIAPK